MKIVNNNIITIQINRWKPPVINNRNSRKMHILLILMYPLLTRRGSHTSNTSIFPIGHAFSCQLRYRDTHTNKR